MFASGDVSDDERETASFQALTSNQAQALRSQTVSVSPWRVVIAQVLVGMLSLGLFWLFSGSASVVWSAAYGALASIIPSTLFARGMTKLSAQTPQAALIGFIFWEGLKVAAAIALLCIAAYVVPNLSWPVLLVTMVICIKVNWAALLWPVSFNAQQGVESTWQLKA